MESNDRRGKKEIAIIAILILLAAITAALYAARNVVYAELNDLKLIPQPERFTELYFENSANLPRATIANQSISFSFTIHNLEGVTTTYPYTVYFLYPSGTEATFASSSVMLADGASTTISVIHKFLTSNLTGRVVVDLPSQGDQQIDFLLPNTNP